MKFATGSLAGQLALLLLLALVIAQGIAIALFALERGEVVRHTHRDVVIARAGTVARLLRETPPALHDAILAAASNGEARFTLTRDPLVGGKGTDERATVISRDLSTSLDINREGVRVAPLGSEFLHDDSHDDSHNHDDDHDHGDEDSQPHWFAASAALAEGNWLNIAIGPPPAVPPWGWTFLFSFLLSVLSVATVAVLMGRRIAKPMLSLAAAANRLGRGEEVGELPEAGPLEIRSTVRAFNLMRGRLDRFVRDRTAMLAAISHDLRTPITSLRLQAELVEDRDSRTRILATLDEMQHMIEDTLAFIREDMQREGTRTVDLNALIESVAADLTDLGHEFVVSESDRVLVKCRALALRRAVRNLLENAGTHGMRSTVRIVREDGYLCVVIEDEGPGIPPSDLERVFEPFVRLGRGAESRRGWRGPRPCHRSNHRPRSRW